MLYRDLQRYINDSTQRLSDSTNIICRLQRIYNAMYICVEKHGNPSLKRNKEKFQQTCNSLINVIELVQCGRRYEAQAILFDLYFSEKGRKHLSTYKVEKLTSFYRMREANVYTQYTRETSNEMYHIPFELRYKVRNERYSISGLPTFYVSSSVFGCWEEIKRANLEFSNVALFKSTKSLLFIDMTLPSPKKTINTSILMGLPLVIASRLDVKHSGAPFISEYIIPQLAMECLIQARNKELNEGTLIGIRYESVHHNSRDLLFKDGDREDLFINYAIPPFSSHENGICPIIKQLFEFWGNTSWAEIKYRNTVGYYEKGSITHYDLSIFGIIEKRLNLHQPGMSTYHTKIINGIPVGALNV